ncbi:hypothetical protein BKA67DRAFT_28978 [Truncatella angustata]|uniref:rRNA-processing protein FYV7 n=1 Tax=Truncatella angustata TaxID=152316 RepID=A0A9P9A4D7_9PEZI|nr:uncharacterized protein BKA67DRAFT_28978 [Truncatella angustata]KAH6659794.1 hypothetical protein BKA67DRAFT_28978 [Truncatella angustata]KAH8196581.1 hypothetical protein TruAng_009239 [Truncatella angustata]
MAPKRPVENDDGSKAAPAAKKARKGFRVGPDNLPDGAWKRKVTKIKKDLIEKAKLKKAYKKIKARELPPAQKPQQGSGESEAAPGPGAEEAKTEDAEQNAAIHPDRQAMLVVEHPDDAESDASDIANMVRQRPTKEEKKERWGDEPRQKPHGKQRKPGYFDKAQNEASRNKAEQESREAEFQRRTEERERKNAERDRFNKALKKARTPGRDGQRKLGRESALMLEKVRRMTQQK